MTRMTRQTRREENMAKSKKMDEAVGVAVHRQTRFLQDVVGHTTVPPRANLYVEVLEMMYQKKMKVLSDGILYRCNHRQKLNPCKCSILQSGIKIIQRGHQIASYPKQANVYESQVIYRDDKREVLKCKGKSAKAITDPISAAHFASNRRMKLVNRKQVYKSVNMARAKTRPVNPKTLDFSFEDDGIPDGLTFHDMVTGRTSSRNHSCRCGRLKMVPLIFVLMSSRTQKDYIRFLEHIKTVTIENRFDLKESVVDFEKAVWLAIEKEFGIGVRIFVSGFHWTQCIFRHVKSLGLTRANRNRRDTLIRGICKFEPPTMLRIGTKLVPKPTVFLM
ncbi:Uncharacterized protein APZ42_020381 [Daphnia magna]|uniref:MULE transposase domain-containing protein n=1 Tax=Daphnia magna TaxID=35525 RepID=A0A162CLP7_9CRUS|nr:Uncharacterized protein APZ42_020381 [Daphnia magna]